ncbi:uncharacterized protein LOC123891475 [Trifolium pratense]|uniref:uncharacterized protein LOC123891475 n=1 Tax=Trifolium pratense TaxID=57577 RepID=UPI001E6953A6|nr:uncharacterized protein LOC123891475 [Trifolium pratense]
MDHQHAFQLKPAGAPYTCSGCGQLGFGSRYHCKDNINCNYILHEECANPDPHPFHPFFEKSIFKFHKEAPGYETRICDACRKDVLGFVYHCSRTNIDLHPCCLKLKRSISDESGNVTLKLLQKVGSKCAKCRHKHVDGKVEGWSYYDGKSYYHVACFKDLILENWSRGYFSQEDRSIASSTNRETQLALTSMEIASSSSGSRRGRTMSKYTKIAVLVFKLIFSAIFGNPISAFVAIVEALASN